MEVILRKFGNSTGLSFSPAVLKELNLKAGQSLTMTTSKDGTITLSPKRKYSLAEMIEQCDLNAAPPADMVLWDAAKPVGGEVI